MAKIETLDDVMNELADRFDIYGACKSEDDEGCFKNTHFCCRVGFMAHYENRLREAIENEKRLADAGF